MCLVPSRHQHHVLVSKTDCTTFALPFLGVVLPIPNSSSKIHQSPGHCCEVVVTHFLVTFIARPGTINREAGAVHGLASSQRRPTYALGTPGVLERVLPYIPLIRLMIFVKQEREFAIVETDSVPDLSRSGKNWSVASELLRTTRASSGDNEAER